MAFYQPKRFFVRSQGEELDISREGGGQLRDIVNKDGPMSSSKNKSVDQGKSSEKTDKASKVLELGDNIELVDLKNE